jgi:hypothetical protein
MADNHQIPTPLEVLARVDQALLDSGLSQPQVEREPIPLFETLLDEWLVCQGLEEHILQQVEWSELLPELLGRVSACEVRESLRVIHEETSQLCRAHGSLNVWKQRELDTRVRVMINHIDQTECHKTSQYKP